MTRRRFLCLGAGEGWHADQLRLAAARLGCDWSTATYESLRAVVENDQMRSRITCDAGAIDGFDAILTRTMPAGTLEQITFRLAALHQIERSSSAGAIVNPARSLEIAIDKFATLAHVAELGYPVPETIVTQSRKDAMGAFQELGGDCVVKPIFGGEGRGVMRIRDAELAWTTFCTLEQLGAVCYVQAFIPPGGSDTRLLVIGDTVLGIRRGNSKDFRTNVSSGGRCEAIDVSAGQIDLARRVCNAIGLLFASVDLLDTDDGHSRILEVNAIPGWKGAQSVHDFNIAEQIMGLLIQQSACHGAQV